MSFERFIEKTRKEPEKHRDLLIKEREILESNLRSYMSWSLTLLSIGIGYVAFIISQKLYYPIFIIVYIMLIIAYAINLKLIHDAEINLSLVKEILYGDCMKNSPQWNFVKRITILYIILSILFILAFIFKW